MYVPVNKLYVAPGPAHSNRKLQSNHSSFIPLFLFLFLCWPLRGASTIPNLHLVARSEGVIRFHLFLNRTPIFDWCVWLGDDQRSNTRKKHILIRDWSTSSNLIYLLHTQFWGHTIGEDLGIQLSNQLTCTSDTHTSIRGGPIFANATSQQASFRCVNVIG